MTGRRVVSGALRPRDPVVPIAAGDQPTVPAGYRTLFPAPRQVVLEAAEFPSPGPGELLLRTEHTLISTGTELTALSGDFPPDSRWASYVRYPFPAGYSNVGLVLQVGAEVTRFQPGDRVASLGPHATHVVCAASRAWKVPDGVDAEAAAFSTLAEIVMGGLRRGRLAFGEAVVVVGAGLLGQLATHFSRIAGAWPIIVVDPAAERLPSARRMGATHALPAAADDARAEIEAITRGRMADVVFEITGSPRAIPGALRLARRLGRVVLLGSPRGPVALDLHDEVHSLGLELIGAHNSTHPAVETPHAPWTLSRHVELFLEWQAAGVIDVRPLVTHRYSWPETPAAFRMLLEDRSQALGVILDWTAAEQ